MRCPQQKTIHFRSWLIWWKQIGQLDFSSSISLITFSSCLIRSSSFLFWSLYFVSAFQWFENYCWNNHSTWKYWTLSFLVIFAIFWLIFYFRSELEMNNFTKILFHMRLTLFISVTSCCSLLVNFDFKSLISAYKVVIILRWFSLSTCSGMRLCCTSIQLS